MYAIFACIEDAEFKDVSPHGQMMVHLFESEQEALDWAIDLLMDKGDILMHEGHWVLSEDWEKDGRFCHHHRDKEDALIAWQETLAPLNLFHLAEVKDHRQLGG